MTHSNGLKSVVSKKKNRLKEPLKQGTQWKKKVQVVAGGYTSAIYLPWEILRELKLNAGDSVSITYKNKSVIIKKEVGNSSKD